MTKRTTISIPDDLYKKMEAHKHEFNYSKEFQNHISELIEKKEAFQSRLHGKEEEMAKIIKRLRAEKIKSFEKFEQIGKDDGLRWAKAASYDSLVFVLDWEFVSEPPPDSDSFIREELFNYLRERSSEYGQTFILSKPDEEKWLTEEGEKYMYGWRSAVLDFWLEVEDKL